MGKRVRHARRGLNGGEEGGARRELLHGRSAGQLGKSDPQAAWGNVSRPIDRQPFARDFRRS